MELKATACFQLHISLPVTVKSCIAFGFICIIQLLPFKKCVRDHKCFLAKYKAGIKTSQKEVDLLNVMFGERYHTNR